MRSPDTNQRAKYTEPRKARRRGKSANLFPLAAYQFQEGVGDESKRNAFSNTEGEWHHQQRQECRDGLCNIVPINVDDIFEHQTVNNNQLWNSGLKQGQPVVHALGH